MGGRSLLVAALLVSLALGCAKSPDAERKQVESPTGNHALTEADRTEFGLPLPGVLTLATSDDISSANGLSDEVRAVVNRYIEEQHQGVKWQVSALRVVGSHLLLWLNFPGIADGGVDIIYSKEKKAVVGTFLGGYRG